VRFLLIHTITETDEGGQAMGKDINIL